MHNAATPHADSPETINFRPLSRTDLPLLHCWLNEPHVQAWWHDILTLEDVERKYGPRIDEAAPTRCFIIEVEGIPIGMIQGYRHADLPQWDRAIGIPAAGGIDYLIGEPARCGKGIGSKAISAFTAVLFDLYPDVNIIVAAPQKDNTASCRALEKARFTLIYEAVLDSSDPSDVGVSAVYSLPRPA